MEFQRPAGVLAPLLGSAGAGGRERLAEAGYQAERAGVQRLQVREPLLPSLAQPAGAEVVLAEAVVGVLPEGDRAGGVALRQGGRADPGLVGLGQAPERAEAGLEAGEEVLQRGAA